MWQITKARTLFTNLVIESNDWVAPLQRKETYELKIEGLDPMHYEIVSRGADNQTADESVSPGDYLIRIWYDGAPSWVSLPRNVYFKPEASPSPDEPRTWASLSDLRELQRQIFYKSTDGTPQSAEMVPRVAALRESDLIRKTIEADALEKRITIPGIGLEFANKVAPWFMALAVLGLVVQIRNQVRRTFLDPELALNEPWLILDGRRGLEKAVAACWGFAIFIAPWVVTCCLIAVSTAEGMADGWRTGIGTEVLFILSLTGLLLLGGWSSLTVTGELLRLRRLRLEQLAALPLQGDSSLGAAESKPSV